MGKKHPIWIIDVGRYVRTRLGHLKKTKMKRTIGVKKFDGDAMMTLDNFLSSTESVDIRKHGRTAMTRCLDLSLSIAARRYNITLLLSASQIFFFKQPPALFICGTTNVVRLYRKNNWWRWFALNYFKKKK